MPMSIVNIAHFTVPLLTNTSTGFYTRAMAASLLTGSSVGLCWTGWLLCFMPLLYCMRRVGRDINESISALDA